MKASATRAAEVEAGVEKKSGKKEQKKAFARGSNKTNANDAILSVLLTSEERREVSGARMADDLSRTYGAAMLGTISTTVVGLCVSSLPFTTWKQGDTGNEVPTMNYWVYDIFLCLVALVQILAWTLAFGARQRMYWNYEVAFKVYGPALLGTSFLLLFFLSVLPKLTYGGQYNVRWIFFDLIVLYAGTFFATIAVHAYFRHFQIGEKAITDKQMENANSKEADSGLRSGPLMFANFVFQISVLCAYPVYFIP